MSSENELRIIYLYEFKFGHNAGNLKHQYFNGEDSVTESTMRRWFAKFRSGDFGLEDEEGRGWKPSIENDQLRTFVESNLQTTV